MSIPRRDFFLFDPQLAALDSSARELLVGGDERQAGCSYFLRVAAIVYASRLPGLQVQIVGRNETDVRRDHVYGPKGLLALLSELQREKGVRLSENSASFATGSSIRWAGLGRTAEISGILSRRIDFLLVDDADAIPEAVFRRLVEHTLEGADGPQKKIIAASGNVSESWVGRYWNGRRVEGRAYVPMTPRDIPEDLRSETEGIVFRSFVDEVFPGFLWLPHNELVADSIQLLLDEDYDEQGRRLDGVAAFMPPQLGKTTLGCLAAACYETANPTSWTGFASYSSSKANRHSFEARTYYTRAGGEIRLGAGSVNWWENVYGGGMWSAGTAAKQAGRPMSLGVVDDGDADLADAIAPKKQEEKHRWLDGTWLARQSTFGIRRLQHLLNATRWDPTDLSAYSITQAALRGERWRIVLLPALYDPDVRLQFTDPETIRDLYEYRGTEVAEKLAELIPTNFELVEDWRTKPGEPIVPEKWRDRLPAVRNEEEWRLYFDVVGQEIAESEYQQNPKPAKGGGKFDRLWLSVLDWEEWLELRKDVVASSRGWDDGATDDAGDATAGVRLDLLRDDRIVVSDAIEERIPGSAVKALKVQTAQTDGRGVVVVTPQDPAAAGKADFEATRDLLLAETRLTKKQIVADRPTKAKPIRWRPLASKARPREDWTEGGEKIFRPGRVCIVRGPGGTVGQGDVPLTRFLNQFHNARGLEGEENDLVDATASADLGLSKPKKKPQVY